MTVVKTVLFGLAVYVGVRVLAGFLGINPLDWGEKARRELSASTTTREVRL